MQDGKRCSGSIPYGYTRLPGDKQTLVVDEEASKVVRRIFDLACEGIGPTQIANILTEEKVLIPSAYAQEHQTGGASAKRSYHNPALWSCNTVSGILDRQEYLGHTVLGKTICENFKTKKRRKATADELLFFPDTHEAIITQETWDMAQRLRKRGTKRLANGSYSHRLSGLIFCADCGGRMSYASPESLPEEKRHQDSSSHFQCSHYKNRISPCESHYIKASVLEAAILQAVQAVSAQVLKDEDGFVQELMTQWESQQAITSSGDRKELAAAEQRMDELDMLVKNLYESNVTGKLSDRQFQRLSVQYDEEQAQLEKRIAEIQESMDKEAPKKADLNRFVALVKRYRDIDSLTDTMVYSFIEKVLVHKPTGGRGANRSQKIDIHFNFIGNYVPASLIQTEEERQAAVTAQAEEARKKKNERSIQRRREKLAAMKEAAKTDPDAAAEYERYLEKRREASRRQREKLKAIKEADPEYIRQMEEKERARAEKALEKERRRQERASRKRKETRSELVARAKTDPEAAEQLAALRAKEAEARAKKKTEQEQRMAEDPEYAAQMRQRQLEYSRRRSDNRKARLAEMKEKAAAGDEVAILALEEHRAYYREASKRSQRKLYADAAAGDPEAIAKLDKKRQSGRDAYHEKKSELDARVEAGDPDAIAEQANQQAAHCERVKESIRRMKEAAAAGDPEATARLTHLREYNKDYLQMYNQERKELKEVAV